MKIQVGSTLPSPATFCRQPCIGTNIIDNLPISFVFRRQYNQCIIINQCNNKQSVSYEFVHPLSWTIPLQALNCWSIQQPEYDPIHSSKTCSFMRNSRSNIRIFDRYASAKAFKSTLTFLIIKSCIGAGKVYISKFSFCLIILRKKNIFFPNDLKCIIKH